MDLRNRTPAGAGAVAAALLVESCRKAPADHPSLGIVRDLALDLERRLAALGRPPSEEADNADSLVEAALACGDLATLAACNRSALPKADEPLAVAAVHLAAGTARALLVLVEAQVDTQVDTQVETQSEARSGALDETYAENALRDARGARWRADLAVRQVEDLRRGEAPG